MFRFSVSPCRFLVVPAVVIAAGLMAAPAFCQSAPAGAAAPAATPELRVFDSSLIDKTIDPCENFYRFSCKMCIRDRHNNHHAHPISARHGMAWYEIDPNYWGIWLLSKIGLVRKIHVAKFDSANPRPAEH